MTLAYIALGGAVGAVARYGISGWVYDRLGDAFPWGTLAVNILGCLALGVVMRWLQVSAAHPALRPSLTIGLLGAFTTFSTFSYEAVALLQDGQWARAGLYVGGSVLVGLIAVVAGMAVVTGLARAGGAA
ncbi:MAG: fluoride efflux transporter CrcB [Candidatus Palauibacterales bacterium]|nr:fluoride efflux transporter CrcB [Candidatus Palauibacterales bacterium]